MSPSTCTEPGDKPLACSDHHAQEVSVMLLVDLSLASVVQHSPFQYHAFAYRYRSSTKVSFRSSGVMTIDIFMHSGRDIFGK